MLATSLALGSVLIAALLIVTLFANYLLGTTFRGLIVVFFALSLLTLGLIVDPIHPRHESLVDRSSGGLARCPLTSIPCNDVPWNTEPFIALSGFSLFLRSSVQTFIPKLPWRRTSPALKRSVKRTGFRESKQISYFTNRHLLVLADIARQVRVANDPPIRCGKYVARATFAAVYVHSNLTVLPHVPVKGHHLAIRVL